MRGMMIHCGGEMVSYDALDEIEVPEQTETYIPVPYQAFVDLVKDCLEAERLRVVDEGFAINKEGKQMFGLLKIDTAEDQDIGLCVALRSSYDKSLSNGVAIGTQVFVCDNLCFSGDLITLMRKHTKNVWEDLEALLAGAFGSVTSDYLDFTEGLLALKGDLIGMETGYRVLGLAYGHKLLTSRQASVAFEEWRSPSHHFGDRSLWSLYNAGTEALKKGDVGGILARHAAWDKFVMDMARHRGAPW
jgi:hypothetical protein